MRTFPVVIDGTTYSVEWEDGVAVAEHPSHSDDLFLTAYVSNDTGTERDVLIGLLCSAIRGEALSIERAATFPSARSFDSETVLAASDRLARLVAQLREVIG